MRTLFWFLAGFFALSIACNTTNAAYEKSIQATAQAIQIKMDSDKATATAQAQIAKPAPAVLPLSTPMAPTATLTLTLGITPSAVISPAVTSTPASAEALMANCPDTPVELAPIGEFLTVWSQRQAEFKCPLGDGKFNRGHSLQQFENGWLIWTDTDGDGNNADGSVDLIFVIMNDKSWKTEVDSWTEGHIFCPEAEAHGDNAPWGGPGKYWCETGWKALGKPLGPMMGGGETKTGIIQCFQQGCMIYVEPTDQIWALHSAGVNWEVFQR